MKEDNNLTDKKYTLYQKERNEDRRHAERYDISPEDNTVGRITICR